MIYILITTSLILNDFEIRQMQYTTGINYVKKYFNNNCKIIIIENNGKRNTFLNDFDVDVFYTDNNNYTINKGATELNDINDCINYYKINDDDFIVKITGRYLLNENSNFVNHLNVDKYDCLIQYGSFLNPQTNKMNDCITGLIGMKCRYIKQIEYPLEYECVEWNWAKVTFNIQDDKICILDGLGIYICPGSNNYFLV